MNLRRATRMPRADVVIELDSPEELFYADPSGLLTGSNRIDSGMDELVERILALKNPPVTSALCWTLHMSAPRKRRQPWLWRCTAIASCDGVERFGNST